MLLQTKMEGKYYKRKSKFFPML